jgi:hypothetical protein
MEPEDVASFLKISKRQARDYIKVFRIMCSEVEAKVPAGSPDKPRGSRNANLGEKGAFHHSRQTG